MSDREPARVRFAPPTWLRWLNVPAAVLLAALIVGPLTQILSAPAWAVAACPTLAVALWFGWRGVRAEVIVDATNVEYRGFLKDLTIPKSALLAYADYSRGLVAWLGQDIPEVTWDAGSGRTGTTRLWAFALRNEMEPIGAGGVRRVRGELERTLRAAVREAHLERKRGKPGREG